MKGLRVSYGYRLYTTRLEYVYVIENGGYVRKRIVRRWSGTWGT